MKKYFPYFSILAAGIFWGMIGLFSRTFLTAGLSPGSIVVIRNLGGAVLLVLLFFIKDRTVFRVAPRDLKYFFGTGIVSVLCFTLCYFSCQETCSLSVAAVLLYTAPTFVVLLSRLLWKEPVTRRKLLALLLAVAGCVLVSGLLGGSIAVTPLGFLLGLGSGFFYALYSIFGRYALARYSPYTVTLWTFLFAGVGSLILLRPAELAPVLRQPGMLLAAVLLALMSTVAPYLLYTWGLARVEAGKAAILASVEPVAATLVSVFVFGEPFSLMGGAGVACILLAVILLR